MTHDHESVNHPVVACRGVHSNNILRDYHVGISIYFRGKANEVVAENTTNQLDPNHWQIGLKRVYLGKFGTKGQDVEL